MENFFSFDNNPSNNNFDQYRNMNNYFINETKQNSHSTQSKKSKWTSEEDDMLRKSVEIHGTKNWTAIATLVPGRNPKQCRERWTAQLDPNLTKGNWNIEEDMVLLNVQKTHGNSWAKISTFLPGRSPSAVKNRYNWLARRNLTKRDISNNNIFTCNNKVTKPNDLMNQGTMFRPGSFNLVIPQDPKPWYNSFSQIQGTNLSSSSSFDNLTQENQVSRSLSGMLDEDTQWDSYVQYNDTQNAIDELTGDFDWF